MLGLQYWFGFYQHELTIGVHMSPRSWISLLLPVLLPLSYYRSQFELLQSPGLSSLSHSKNSHWLSIYICCCIYIYAAFSIYITLPLFSPPTLVHKCSLRMLLNCCSANTFVSTILLDSIYKHSVQSLSRVRLSATSWTTAHRGSLSITNFQSLPKLVPIESVMPSNHLILCHPFLLPLVFPSIRVFSNDSGFCIRWPKYWSFSFNMGPSNEHPGLISLEWTGWISLQPMGLSRAFSNTTVQKHQFFSTQLSL